MPRARRATRREVPGTPIPDIKDCKIDKPGEPQRAKGADFECANAGKRKPPHTSYSSPQTPILIAMMMATENPSVCSGNPDFVSFVIILLRHRLNFQPLDRRRSSVQASSWHPWMFAPQQERAASPCRIEIAAQLIQVHPNFAEFAAESPRRKNTPHRPLPQRPNRSFWPNLCADGYRFAIDSPTTISRSPGRHQFSLGQSWASASSTPIGSIPRTDTFIPSGLSTLGRFTTVSPSGDTIGSPRGGSSRCPGRLPDNLITFHWSPATPVPHPSLSATPITGVMPGPRQKQISNPPWSRHRQDQHRHRQANTDRCHERRSCGSNRFRRLYLIGTPMNYPVKRSESTIFLREVITAGTSEAKSPCCNGSGNDKGHAACHFNP